MKTTSSDCATPIVPIVKKNGQIRIGGNCKTTVNPALKVNRYPLPKPQDISASLAGGQKQSQSWTSVKLTCNVQLMTGQVRS